MDYCYVLFVKTGDEDRVHRLLANRLNAQLFQPFIPKKAMIFKRFGVYTKILRKCFPGYVFVQSVSPPREFVKNVFPVIYPIKEVYKILNYGGDRNDIALKDNERESLLRLFGEKFTIDCLVGVMEGDKVQIVSGAFLGIEGTVKKIIPRKREVIIEVPFMGDLKPVTLGLDIVEKI